MGQEKGSGGPAVMCAMEARPQIGPGHRSSASRGSVRPGAVFNPAEPSRSIRGVRVAAVGDRRVSPWERCDLCGVGIKSERGAAHRERVHPNALTPEERAANAKRDLERLPRSPEWSPPPKARTANSSDTDDPPDAVREAFERGEILRPIDLVAHPAARAWTLRQMLRSAREGDPQSLTMALQLVTLVEDPAARLELADAGLKESPAQEPWFMLAGWAALGAR